MLCLLDSMTIRPALYHYSPNSNYFSLSQIYLTPPGRYNDILSILLGLSWEGIYDPGEGWLLTMGPATIQTCSNKETDIACHQTIFLVNWHKIPFEVGW